MFDPTKTREENIHAFEEEYCKIYNEGMFIIYVGSDRIPVAARTIIIDMQKLAAIHLLLYKTIISQLDESEE